MIIRKATQADAEAIANYLFMAMETIVYEFIGESDSKKAYDFLHKFTLQENNQYSYQNCWVVEDHNEVIAAVNIYDGSKLVQLRAPIANYIQSKFSKSFNPEDETQDGEYYIDTLGVALKHQGRGIGAKLLQFLINTYVRDKKHVLGLLVDEENPNAKRLYLKLGFEVVGKKVLVGQQMVHLQISPENKL